MFETKFTRTFGVKYPIMQGALGYLSKAELVSAVSNAGGLGTLALAGMTGSKEIREEVRRIKKMTKKPFAANLPLTPGARPCSEEEMCQVLIEEGVPIVETIAMGKIPQNLLDQLKKAKIKIIHKCTKVKYAISAQEQGVDAVALLGFGANGHPGLDEVSHMVQIPKAAKALKVPLVFAGGIADARGFVAALALGADAVLMGTRFLTSAECPIHPNIRERLLSADENDVCLVDVSHNYPTRTLRNKTALEILELEKKGASLEDIVKLRSGVRAARAWREGDVDGGSFACGQVIGLIDEVLPAKTIIDRIIKDAKALVGQLNTLAA